LPVQDKKQVNRELQRLGLGHLNDPALIAQIAFLVRDHDHFRGILMHMPMPDRKEAYECLAPKLRFRAKSLEDYEIESRTLAEMKQLPQYDPKTLEAKEWRPQEFKTSRFDDLPPCTQRVCQKCQNRVPVCDCSCHATHPYEEIKVSESTKKLTTLAERAISTELREATANQRLTLVCRQCTFEQSWKVKRRSSAYKLARQDGWETDKHTALCRLCKPTSIQ
jgi:hypothetical protein